MVQSKDSMVQSKSSDFTKDLGGGEGGRQAFLRNLRINAFGTLTKGVDWSGFPGGGRGAGRSPVGPSNVTTSFVS